LNSWLFNIFSEILINRCPFCCLYSLILRQKLATPSYQHVSGLLSPYWSLTECSECESWPV
jgi:hypothetical protein